MTVTTDPTPALIPSLSPFYTNAHWFGSLGTNYNNSSGNFVGANTACYVPFQLPMAYTVARAYLVNGGGAAGNLDIGIYNQDFSLVAHTGSFAQSGTLTVQYQALAANLTAGNYYMAIVSDNAGATIFFTGNLSASLSRVSGILQQASAFPLPNPMVPVSPTTAFWPLFGITRTTSGF